MSCFDIKRSVSAILCKFGWEYLQERISKYKQNLLSIFVEYIFSDDAYSTFMSYYGTRDHE